MASRGNSAAAGGGSSSAAASGSGGGGGISKAYSSHLAIQTDAAKYRGKYKELKKKVRQIEMENDKLHYKTLRIKRNIQRMRLERAILYERLEAELGASAELSIRANDFNHGTSALHHPSQQLHSHHHHHHHHQHASQSLGGAGSGDFRSRAHDDAAALAEAGALGSHPRGPSPPMYSPSPVREKNTAPAPSAVPPARSSRTGAVMDYSPSPPEEREISQTRAADEEEQVVKSTSSTPARATHAAGEGRGGGPSMKVTLKRSGNHSNGANNGSAKESSW